MLPFLFTHESLVIFWARARLKRPNSPIGSPSRLSVKRILFVAAASPADHRLAPQRCLSFQHSLICYVSTPRKTSTRPPVCNEPSQSRWRGRGMATDTWWHGQKQGSACMGEALRVTKLDHGRNSRRSLDEGSVPTHMKRWKGSLGALAVWPPQARCHNSTRIPAIHTILHMALWTIFLLTSPAAAVFINFENCLSPNIINSNPPQPLQFVPLFVWATLNSTSDSYGLNVTVYGNVTGVATQNTQIPNSTDPSWNNPNDTVGKIPDLGGVPPDQKFTTFTTQFNVLDYTPYDPPPERFCNSSALTPCPFAPVFALDDAHDTQ